MSVLFFVVLQELSETLLVSTQKFVAYNTYT